MSSWSPFDLLAVFISSMLFGPILVGDHLYKCLGISTHSIKHSELGLYIFIPSNDPRSLHRTFINSFSLIITTLFSYTQSWHFCYKISMCHISHHARNIQKQLTCQLNTFLISLKTHAIKVFITMFRVRDVVLRNALYVSQQQSWHLPFCVFSVNLLCWQMMYLHFMRFLVIIFFSLKDQFLVLLRSAAAAQKILEAQVFFEQCYYS